MKRILLLLSILCLYFNNQSAAQALCGFDKIHEERLRTDPQFERRIKEDNRRILEMTQAHPEWRRSNTANRVEALYIIPVVVHVLHTGGAIGTNYNPTDAQITGAINYLNQVYAGTFPGMTAPVAGGGVVNMEIQFALAQRTPSCGATNGIDRVDASSVSGYVANGVLSSSSASDLAIKDFARWNPANYYNIYIVNKIDGVDGYSPGQFIAGYAQFAGGPSSTDGTVMLASQMIAGEKTLPHELGHALNLYHSFQGSNNDTQCPTNTNCTTNGDLVCDTDPVSRNFNVGTNLFNFSCRTGTNTCTGTNYNINTESNFMGYTNCYTLFTNDQKARVQAAMSLGGRASLVSGANQALVPCGTLVNFSVASSSQTEDIAGTTSGCRRYRDVTYQMTIGAGPTATATATLTYSGTAVKGLDYDVTTNGNFSSPSDVLTFASGAAVAQSFTVRIYDDANVEAVETIVLDFNFNNGGGNAVKGTTIPTLTINLNDNEITPNGAGSGVFSVGAYANSTTQVPFNATLARQRAQILYRASELNAANIYAGTINAIQLSIRTKASTRAFNNFTIKMGTSAVSNLFESGSVTVAGGLTTVYTNAAYSTTAGWNNFTLSTPFVWNGTSNIVIEICYENTSTNGTAGQDEVEFYQDGGSATQGNCFFQDNINCSGAFTGGVGGIQAYTTGWKPIIRFNTAITGTSIETVASSNASNHISTGSADYFYSNNGCLMARLNNITAPLGCVAATIPNAGTSWISYQGGQRSAKVFSFTPTTNTATTSYSISLYFDNSELGGKTAGTLRLAKTTAATIAGANSSNTILITPTVNTFGSNGTVFTGNFTGFSLFFLVDAAVTLPVNLIDFSGSINNDQNVVLEWLTASEQNNKEFDIETSRDGANFALLRTVPSKGNAPGLQQYDFLHVKPQAGMNWYRLKQKDLDGKYAYSKVINLNLNRSITKTFVYPVPARDILTINFGEMLEKASIEIFSTDMKSVQKQAINELTIRKEISISALSPGVYFMKIVSGNREETIRFIKQ